MTKELKVYGMKLYKSGERYRAVVATTSKTKAIQLFGVSAYEAKQQMCVTGNSLEIAAAMSEPNTVFAVHQTNQYDDNRVYTPLSLLK
jgi:hypothetical protein